MAEEQDVYIRGIDSSIEAWSTETTQKVISASLRQANADTTGILRLMELLASKSGVSEKELASISVEIAKGNTSAKSDAGRAKAAAGTAAVEDNKHTAKLSSLLSAFGDTTNQLSKNARDQAKRDSIRDDLIEAGMRSKDALSAANNQVNAEKAKAVAVKMAAFVGIASTFATTSTEAVKTGYMERFDMASEMRQSGLFAGMDKASQGFISIAETISKTGFTFGEAAEFTKRFSLAVGVTGVKSALDFSHAVAKGSMETGVGYMEKFSMDFGQVANMSGQYLESLRAAGQLSGRTEMQLRSGMDDFMSNVNLTSNVLKISMEEAAELMQKSVSPVQAGRMLTLSSEKRERAESAMLGMNVQSGPMGDAIADRLSAGSESGFLLSDSYSNMMDMGGLGIDTVKFVNQIAAAIESGDPEWQKKLVEDFPEYTKAITESAKQNRSLILTDDNRAALIGNINAMNQNMANADATTSGGNKDDKAAMLSVEQQRKAQRLAEKAMNSQMGLFTDNLEELTKVLEFSAQQSHDWMESNKELVAASVDLGAELKKIYPVLTGKLLDFTSEDSVEKSQLKVEVTQNAVDTAQKKLDDLPSTTNYQQTSLAEQTLMLAKIALTRAENDLADNIEDRKLKEIDDSKIKDRTNSTNIIEAQSKGAVVTNKDYDTTGEVEAKILELKELLKQAKLVNKEDTKFWNNDASRELKTQSNLHVLTLEKLISKFDKVLDSLNN